MSEGDLFLIAFWALWFIDGTQLVRSGTTSWVNWWGPGSATVFGSVLNVRSPLPSGWRGRADEVPCSISPFGMCNLIAGSARRPAPAPLQSLAWRWDDVQEIASRDGWLLINGQRFCRETGHFSAEELNRLRTLKPLERETILRAKLKSWFAPVGLKRRAAALRLTTGYAALANTILLVLAIGFTLWQLNLDVMRLPMRLMGRFGYGVAILGGYALLLHLLGIGSIWWAHRKLKLKPAPKFRSAIFSAAFLPPQALRLRAMLADGFFPVQHPLSFVLAFGSSETRRIWAFQTVADLQWPLADPSGGPLAEEIAAWYRTALAKTIEPVLISVGLSSGELLGKPPKDSPENGFYCPRCGDQFLSSASGLCPNGIKLRSLNRPV